MGYSDLGLPDYRVTGNGLVAPWCSEKQACDPSAAIGEIVSASPCGSKWSARPFLPKEAWEKSPPPVCSKLCLSHNEARDFIVCVVRNYAPELLKHPKERS